MDYQTNGPLFHWTTGTQDYWFLIIWSASLLDRLTAGIQDFWNTGLLDYSTTGLLKLQDYWTPSQLHY